MQWLTERGLAVLLRPVVGRLIVALVSAVITLLIDAGLLDGELGAALLNVLSSS